MNHLCSDVLVQQGGISGGEIVTANKNDKRRSCI